MHIFLQPIGRVRERGKVLFILLSTTMTHRNVRENGLFKRSISTKDLLWGWNEYNCEITSYNGGSNVFLSLQLK